MSLNAHSSDPLGGGPERHFSNKIFDVKYISAQLKNFFNNSTTQTSSSSPSKNQLDNNGGIKGKINSLIFFLKAILGKFLSLIFNSDILHILRPVVYVYLVMLHGKKSWIPIKVSLAIDLLVILLVFFKLIGAEKLRSIERRDLTRRNIISLLKYLIRDPIFETFTLKVINKIFRVCRIPESLFGILLSVLNYYRYYTYIA